MKEEMTGILDEVFDPIIEQYKEFQRRIEESNGGKPRVSYFQEVIQVTEQLKQQLAERIKSLDWTKYYNDPQKVLADLLGEQKK
jgi:hypothetical protein